MNAPSLTLLNYTFKFDTEDYNTVVKFRDDNGNDDGRVRSVELELVSGSIPGFYLTLEGSDVLLNFPCVPADAQYRKIPLRFTIGYTETDDDVYDDNDMMYMVVDVNVYATSFGSLNPYIRYIDNLASRVGTMAHVTVHGDNFTDGLSVHLYNGETRIIIPPNDIVANIGADGKGTLEFDLVPTMLSEEGVTESCAQYDIYVSYGLQVYGNNGLGIIRYVYDADNEAQQRYALDSLLQDTTCYVTGSMSLMYDTVDENGNAVANAGADPRLGDVIYVRRGVNDDCEQYFYTMVRTKYNKNLTHKNGLLRINGIQLRSGDVVWLSHQAVESENGLWVVDSGNWYGYDPTNYDSSKHSQVVDCLQGCYQNIEPYRVDNTVIVDLGVKASYPVDYVCRDNVPYKCGVRTICNYTVRSGNIVALLNQTNGESGVYRVTCGMWEKLFDIDEADVNGNTVDCSRNVIVQNNIDFCKCGGTYRIDYFLLTPTCYLQHLYRTVKIMCSGSSIAPNHIGNQFDISEYLIRVGEEDALIGYRGVTPGDPVKDSCTVDNEDFEYDFGLGLVEHAQYVISPECILSPTGTSICNVPRIYNVKFTDRYKSSSDRNGFTIKFWRYEKDGWHLYAYIGSGTRTIGMDYYVYHLHVNGNAAEHLVDVNEHDWFSITTGVIADGDGPDAFGLCDDNWEFADGSHLLDSSTLYQSWRISCTTNLFAHCYQFDRELRTKCSDMSIGEKTIAAVGDMCDYCDGIGTVDGAECSMCGGTGRYPHGYLFGMRGLFGVAYYSTAMSKEQFVAEYNRYKSDCIWKDVIDLIVTDDNTQGVGLTLIATDDDKGLRG